MNCPVTTDFRELSETDSTSRHLGIKTVLPDDSLLLTAFTGFESLSQLFEFKLHLVTRLETVDPQELVGTPVTFWVQSSSGRKRFFHGFVNQCSAGTATGEFRHFTATVVPWLWFLTQTTDCRTFQDTTLGEILEQIFGEYQFAEFESNGLEGRRHDYVVQYRESDYAFIARLLAEHGVYYTFRHEDSRHVLVLSDHSTDYPWNPHSEVHMVSRQEDGQRSEALTSWQREYRFIPGFTSRTDHNFRLQHNGQPTPARRLISMARSFIELPHNSVLEMFDYPGDYQTTDDGETTASVEMGDYEVEHDTVIGSSTYEEFTPGTKFTVVSHPTAREVQRRYVITSLEHSAVEPSSRSHAETPGCQYSNSFGAIPASVKFRPEHIPKPVISGSQTALVVGPRGEEIWTDEYGRVQIQFFWDRRNDRSGENCCWVRCAQSIAGKGWGSMFLPRVGQEVVVSFLEGNPSRPVITGLVYNADQPTPYPLPEEKTKSTIKTCSSPGGDGFNEIRFEDKKGSEQILIHAERDCDVRVGGVKAQSIGGSYHLTVGAGQTGPDSLDYVEHIHRSKAVHVQGSWGNWIESEYFVQCQAKCMFDVQNFLLDSDTGCHINSSQASIQANDITLRTGDSFIRITRDAILIESPNVLINSGGSPGASGSIPDIPSAPTPHEADQARSGLVSTPWPS